MRKNSHHEKSITYRGPEGKIQKLSERCIITLLLFNQLLINWLSDELLVSFLH